VSSAAPQGRRVPLLEWGDPRRATSSWRWGRGRATLALGDWRLAIGAIVIAMAIEHRTPAVRPTRAARAARW
jgi:hypothetical protein